jgi:UTP:GlnB (protein PII) uridylyltransferase
VTEAENGSCSVLKIRTADRPGLLVDIVRVLKDVNLNVVSAEVDTVGTEAQDEFFLTYRVGMLEYTERTVQTLYFKLNAIIYYIKLYKTY